MDQEKIGIFIAECRKEKKLTQEQLAEKLGVTDKSISRWENGKTMPDISLFEPLCNELNISVAELLKGERIHSEIISDKKASVNLSAKTLMSYTQYIKCKNKRILLSVFFVVSLLPMLLNQYGGLKGVSEISGLINLFNPIGILSVLLFALGVWLPLKNNKLSKLIGALGVIGIVISEIYKFLTWHIMNITGKFSIQSSINLAFPEFYVGLIISLVMVIIYFCIDKIIK